MGAYDPENIEDEADLPDHPSLFEYWPRRGERVIYDTNGRGANITTDFDRLTFVNETTDDEHGHVTERIFYNKSGKMKIEPEVGALRPKTSNSLQWRERSTGEASTDTEIVLEDKDKDRPTIRGRFDTAEAIFDAEREDVPAYYETTPDGYEVHANGGQKTYATKAKMTQDYKYLRPPFIPEREFTDPSGDTRLPTEDDFIFIVYPDDNTDAYDGPHIYEHGELRPLVSAESNTENVEETAQQPTESGESDIEHSDEEQDEDSDDDGEPPQQSAAGENTNDDSGQNEEHDTTPEDESGVGGAVSALRDN